MLPIPALDLLHFISQLFRMALLFLFSAFFEQFGIGEFKAPTARWRWRLADGLVGRFRSARIASIA
jgi:hypothetical protein